MAQSMKPGVVLFVFSCTPTAASLFVSRCPAVSGTQPDQHHRRTQLNFCSSSSCPSRDAQRPPWWCLTDTALRFSVHGALCCLVCSAASAQATRHAQLGLDEARKRREASGVSGLSGLRCTNPLGGFPVAAASPRFLFPNGREALFAFRPALRCAFPFPSFH